MRSRPIVNHCLHFGRVVALISVIGLLSLWICTPLAQAQNDGSSTASGQFLTYVDPYWGFSVLYPSDWVVQPFPYKDFGFRISSPEIEVDPLGKPLNGAYVSVTWLPMPSAEWEEYAASKRTWASENNFSSAMSGNTFEYRGTDVYGNYIVERAFHAYEGVLRAVSVSSSNSVALSTVGEQIIGSIAIVGPGSPHPLPDYEELGINLSSFNFTPIKHAFQIGPGRIIADHNAGSHTGGDNYALDICEGSNCWAGGVGQYVIAPTDITLIYSGDLNGVAGDPNDFHLFEIANDGANRLCMSLAHFAILLPGLTVGKTVPRGAAIGTLIEYNAASSTEHIHMGLYTISAAKTCGELGRFEVAYTGLYQLDGKDYDVSSSWSGTTITSTNAPFCAVPSGSKATLSEGVSPTASPGDCFGGGSCSAPSLVSPSSNAVLGTRTVTFSWNAVSGCALQGYLFRICESPPISDPGDCFVDDTVTGTQWTVTINGHDNVNLYWGVSAKTSTNVANWSESSFRIDPGGGGGEGDTCESYEEPDDDEVILFDEPHWGPGLCAKLRVGEYDDLGEFELNNETTSIRVGDDVEVTLYEEPDRDDDSDHETFDEDVENLGSGAENDDRLNKDEASSASVQWEDDSPSGSCKTKEPGPNEAMIFEHKEYNNNTQGACTTLAVGEYPTLSGYYADGIEWNNEISSLKVGENVKLVLYGRSGSDWSDAEGKETFDPGEDAPNLDGSDVKGDKASAAKVYYWLATPTVFEIANPTGSSEFNVGWSNVQYAQNYDVEEQFNDGAWTRIVDNQSGTTLHRVGKAIGKWCYRVRAGHSMADGSFSQPTCTVVSPPPPVPQIPALSDIANSQGSNSYTVQWQTVAHADYFELQEAVDGAAWATIYTGPELAVWRVDKPNGQWCYRIKAIGLGGESDWSGEKCTVVQPPPVCVPGADGIILYEQPNFAGRCVTLTADDSDLTDNAFDNLVSSFQFVGSYANAGWQIGLFANPIYSGAYSNFSRNDPDLSNDLGNRQASSFRLWRDGDDNRRLYLGQPVNGTIHVPNDSDGYWFYGTAGQRVTIKMNKQTAGLDAYLMLYGPNWGLVARDDDSGGDNNALMLDVQLWSTGTHYLYARSFAGQSAGAYTLQVQCSPGANGIVLYEGISHTGRCVTLTGDVANLTTVAFNDAVSSIRFVGSYANAGWQVGLFANSNYSGATKNFSGNDPNLSNDIGNRVASSFRLWRDGDDGRSLATGQSLNGTIHVPNDSDGYWFYGTAGQRVTITMNKQAAGLDPFLILYGPYWGIVAQDDDSGGDRNARIYNVQLWATGVHHLYARSYSGLSAGGYTVTLSPGQ